MRLGILALGLCLASSGPAVLADSRFVNGLALDGAALDVSGGTSANDGRVGYFSDLFYDAKRKHWWALSDRGPGGGALNYDTRVQRFKLDVDPTTGGIGGFKVLQTVIFRDEAGNPLDGIAPNPTSVLGSAFDPEGFVVHPKTGHFYVSDEYGPSLYEFNREGIRLRTLHDAGQPRAAQRGDRRAQLRGRRRQHRRQAHQPRLRRPGHQSGRRVRLRDAAERDARRGCAATACATASSSSTPRPARRSRSTPTRWTARPRAGASRRWSRSTTTSSWCSSATTAASGSAQDLSAEQEGLPHRPRGAVDVSDVPFRAGAACPAGKVAKTGPWLDLAATRWPALGGKVPEKWEGLAIGPQLQDGSYLCWPAPTTTTASPRTAATSSSTSTSASPTPTRTRRRSSARWGPPAAAICTDDGAARSPRCRSITGCCRACCTPTRSRRAISGTSSPRCRRSSRPLCRPARRCRRSNAPVAPAGCCASRSAPRISRHLGSRRRTRPGGYVIPLSR